MLTIYALFMCHWLQGQPASQCSQLAAVPTFSSAGDCLAWRDQRWPGGWIGYHGANPPPPGTPQQRAVCMSHQQDWQPVDGD